MLCCDMLWCPEQCVRFHSFPHTVRFFPLRWCGPTTSKLNIQMQLLRVGPCSECGLCSDCVCGYTWLVLFGGVCCMLLFT